MNETYFSRGTGQFDVSTGSHDFLRYFLYDLKSKISEYVIGRTTNLFLLPTRVRYTTWDIDWYFNELYKFFSICVHSCQSLYHNLKMNVRESGNNVLLSRKLLICRIVEVGWKFVFSSGSNRPNKIKFLNWRSILKIWFKFWID